MGSIEGLNRIVFRPSRTPDLPSEALRVVLPAATSKAPRIMFDVEYNTACRQSVVGTLSNRQSAGSARDELLNELISIVSGTDGPSGRNRLDALELLKSTPLTDKVKALTASLKDGAISRKLDAGIACAVLNELTVSASAGSREARTYLLKLIQPDYLEPDNKTRAVMRTIWYDQQSEYSMCKELLVDWFLKQKNLPIRSANLAERLSAREDFKAWCRLLHSAPGANLPSSEAGRINAYRQTALMKVGFCVEGFGRLPDNVTMNEIAATATEWLTSKLATDRQKELIGESIVRRMQREPDTDTVVSSIRKGVRRQNADSAVTMLIRAVDNVAVSLKDRTELTARLSTWQGGR